MKNQDAFASSSRDVLADSPDSVKSRSTTAEIAREPCTVWSGKGRSSAKTPVSPAAAPSASTSRAPGFHVQWPEQIAPQLAVLAEHAPAGDEWLHEMKFDGYRILAFAIGGAKRPGVRLITRRGQDWTERFPKLAQTLAGLKADSAILDGEAVMLDEKGRSDFQAMQNVLKQHSSGGVVYYIFDLLFLNGADLRPLPLIERKEKLERLLKNSLLPTTVRFSEHVRGRGDKVIERACRMGMEGIVSKRADSPYVPRRDASWLKSKCGQRQEMIIIGFTEPRGSRNDLGALLLGYYDEDKRLAYAGRVGTGFNQETLRDLRKQLDAIAQSESPLADKPPAREARNAHWVKPELVAEIAFANWTSDGHLRQPVFAGLRQDKPAGQVVREMPIESKKVLASENGNESPRKSSRGKPAVQKTSRKKSPVSATPDAAPLPVRLTHSDRVVDRESGVTKGELAEYYLRIAEWMLPRVIDRPLTLLRCPAGVGPSCFFQRNWTVGFPTGTRGEKSHKGQRQLAVHDQDGLLALVQMNALEIHTWGCRQRDQNHPDQLVFDLDPGPGLPWSEVIKTARELKKILGELKLPTFVKTTGGKGLHVVVPIAPTVLWDAAHAFCEQAAASLVKRSAGQAIMNMRKDLRSGKLYIDVQRNHETATAVAPYSSRARSGAAVSMPVEWEQLDSIRSGDAFNVKNAESHVKKRRRDPWADFDQARVDLQRIAAGESPA